MLVVLSDKGWGEKGEGGGGGGTFHIVLRNWNTFAR